MFIISIFIGLVLVISSLFMIKREINKATYSRNKLIEETDLYDQADLLKILEDLQLSLNQVNESFYDIANDLEGKYSVHEKEISDLQERLDLLISNQQVSKRHQLNKGNQETSKQQFQMTQKTSQVHLSHSQEPGVIYEASHQNHFEKTQASALREEVNKQSHDSSSTALDDETVSDVRTKVIELRSQGYSLAEIAKKLGVGIGELQLMLNIKK